MTVLSAYRYLCLKGSKWLLDFPDSYPHRRDSLRVPAVRGQVQASPPPPLSHREQAARRGRRKSREERSVR